jgi:hypothetical protein
MAYFYRIFCSKKHKKAAYRIAYLAQQNRILFRSLLVSDLNINF